MGRKSWRKLWQDALRSSPKYSRLTASEKGCYLECFLLANEAGELLLRPGKPLTVSDIAYEMNTRPHTAQRWIDSLLDCGLLDGSGCALTLPRYVALTCSTSVSKSANETQMEHRWNTSGTQVGHNRNRSGTGRTLSAKELRRHSPARARDKRREERREPPQNPPKGASLVTEFEEQFWPHVPTKIGKGAAREAFLKARTGKGKHTEPSDLQTILDGLPGFAAYENQRAQQDGYRPLHPSTWLNQERWTDQPVAEGGRATRICTHWDDGTPIPAGHPIHGNRWPAEIQGTNGTPWRVTTDGAVLKHEGGAWRRQGVIRKTNP